MKEDILFRELPDSFDERVPPPAPPARRFPSLKLAIGALLHLSFAAVFLLEIVPRFEQVYRDVKLPMPSATLTLIMLSKIACDLPVLMAAVITAIAAALSTLKDRKAAIAGVLVPFLCCVLLAWMFVALFLPMNCTFCSIGPRSH